MEQINLDDYNKLRQETHVPSEIQLRVQRERELWGCDGNPESNFTSKKRVGSRLITTLFAFLAALGGFWLYIQLGIEGNSLVWAILGITLVVTGTTALVLLLAQPTKQPLN